MVTPLQKLPLRSERGVPIWDDVDRESVERYFEDLERLFAKHEVTEEADKKAGAVIYVPTTVAKVWKSLPEFTNNEKKYEDFKAEILGMYMGYEEDELWTVQDYDALVGERTRIGFSSGEDYLAFYRKFYPVARYLIEHGKLFERDVASRLQNLTTGAVAVEVDARLHMKNLDKRRRGAYTIDQVHEAIMYSFDNPSRADTARYTQGTPANAKPEPTSSTEPGEIRIKMEQLEALMTSAATTAVNVMLNNQSQYANTAPPPNQPFGGVRPRYQIQGQGPNAPPNRGPGPGPNQRAPCYYCHTPGCLTWRCPHVEADIQAGLIKRAVGSNRIVLPSSAEIPNDPPNASWREQVQEYHRKNPGQQARGGLEHMMLTITPPPVIEDCTRTEDEEIEAMQAQLSMLLERKNRRQQFDGVEIPSRPNQRTGPPVNRERIREPPPHLDTATRGTSPGPVVHPYARTTEVAARPSREDQAYKSSMESAALGDGQAKPHEPAYRNQAAIVDPTAEARVFDRVFGQTASVSMTPIELLSVSPGVRKRMVDAASTRRTALKPVAAEVLSTVSGAANAESSPTEEVRTSHVMAYVEEVDDEDEPLARKMVRWSDREKEREVPLKTLPPASTFEGKDALPTGVYRVRQSESADKSSSTNAPLVVAQETGKLRSIYAWINDAKLVECILDPGSQIVAISEKKCFELKIAYDPSKRVPMTSANGTTDFTLGLACNVPIEFGGCITEYLQMHVVRNASYDVLLGRPFDILMSCTVRNSPDGKQTLAITCPNTGEQRVLPTYARGESPNFPNEKREGFQSSRI